MADFEKIGRAMVHDETIVTGDISEAYAKAKAIDGSLGEDEFKAFIHPIRENYAKAQEFNKLFQKCSEDAAFADKVESADSPEAVYELAKDFVNLSKEEFVLILNATENMMKDVAGKEGELSDEDMSAVAGGFDFGKFAKNCGKTLWAKTKASVAIAGAVVTTVSTGGTAAGVAWAGAGMAVADNAGNFVDGIKGMYNEIKTLF